jgi:hypothetical protein
MDRYEGTLEDTELLEQRQISMSGFYVEKERIHKILTCTSRYPSNTAFFIMLMLGFWGVPHKN